MKKINIEELKELQLNILDFVTNICEENNIKYWLEFGTLIGAVRHNGYIPWDDDIDIGMLRQDYKRFKEIFKDESNRYILHDLENDLNYNLLFAKIYDTKTIEKDPNMMCNSCVNIDIFIFDDIPENPEIQKKYFRKRDIYRKLNNYQVLPNNKKSIWKRIVLFFVKIILFFFPKNFFIYKINNFIQSHEGKEKYVGNLCGLANYAFNKSCVDTTILVPFENRKYRIPIGYDEMLTNCFGNYMELPPEEKRHFPHSSIEIYMIDDF